jgi:hypothetical protein
MRLGIAFYEEYDTVEGHVPRWESAANKKA